MVFGCSIFVRKVTFVDGVVLYFKVEEERKKSVVRVTMWVCKG